MDAYTVAARLTLTSNVPQILETMLREFGRLNTALKSAQENVDRLAGSLRALGSGAQGIGGLQRTLDALGKVRLNSGLVSDMQAMTAGARELATAQNAMTAGAREAAAAYRQMAAAQRTMVGNAGRPGAGSAGAGGNYGAGRGSGSGAGGGGSYNAPAVLAASGGAGFSRHDLLTAGVGLGMAGHAGVGFFERAFMAEAEMLHQLSSLRMRTNISDAQVAEARRVAERITRETPGVTAAEAVHSIVDALTITADLTEALKAAPVSAQLNYVLRNMPGARQGDSAFAAMQATELMQRHYNPQTHHVDMDALNRQVAAMQRVALATGGRVNGATYLGFAKQARIGGMVANDQYLYEDLPALLIALGGNRTGTGDAAVWSQFISGRMTRNAFTALRRTGLIDRSARWQGGQVQDMMRHLSGAELLGANRVEWARQYILGPQGILARNNIDPNNRLAVGNFLSQWASRQTGLGFLSELALGMEGINKERQGIRNTTTNPMAVMQQHDPLQRIREFRAAENEMMITIGQAAMGPGIEVLKQLTAALRGLSEFGKAHPDLVRELTIIGAGLSAVAQGAGAAALVLFVGAPVVMGMNALGTALAGFSPAAAAGAALATLPPALGALAGALARLSVLAGAIALGPVIDRLNERMTGNSSVIGSFLPGGYLPGVGWVRRQLGLDPSGPTATGGSYQAPSLVSPGGASGGSQQFRGDVYLDGTRVGRIVGQSIGRELELPNQGMTGPDIRISPFSAR